jgi:hypothetical protein
MKHLLMDPAFPDIVGEYAFGETADTRTPLSVFANDNGDVLDREISDPLFEMMARSDVAATRLW